MNKILKIVFVVLLIGTFVNFMFILSKKNHKNTQLVEQNQLLKKQKQIYEQSLKLIYSNNCVQLPDTAFSGYAIYFPSQACSMCLEDLLLIIENDFNFQDEFIVYFDDSDKIEMIDIFNDMYCTNFRYLLGKPLFNKIQSQISLLKATKGCVNGILLLNANNKEEYKSLLHLFITMQ